MRWSFHKRRDRRYQIALEELRKTFMDCKGAEIGLNNPKCSSRQERLLLREFKQIQSCIAPKNKGYKRTHNRFLKLIRKSLIRLDKMKLKEPWHLNINKIVLELCKTKFYRVHLFLFGQRLLRDLFASLTCKQVAKELDFDKHFSQYSFLDESHLILDSQPAIFLERDFRKFNESIVQTIFDPHMYNHPFLLYSFAIFRNGKLRRIKMVRMGSPTREFLGRTPHVIEEFKGFLKILKIENKNHLYINKQRTWGKEGQRSFAIKSLERKYDNFFCICLPSDGAFYYQQMSYSHKNDAETFKDTFYDLLVSKQGLGYYHFPQKWLDDENFCHGMKMIIESVHSMYFSNKNKLTIFERRCFIDHVYTQLIIYCLQNFEINSVNITCRDGIDRAGCEQTKLLYYFQISLGIENELDSKIERQFLMHIPPYLAKNRPIVKERREYLYQLLHASYNTDICKKIQDKAKAEPLLHLKPHFVKRSKLLDK